MILLSSFFLSFLLSLLFFPSFLFHSIQIDFCLIFIYSYRVLKTLERGRWINKDYNIWYFELIIYQRQIKCLVFPELIYQEMEYNYRILQDWKIISILFQTNPLVKLTQSTSHERMKVGPQDPGQQEEEGNGLESQIKA